jgi:hypothetical protein
MKTFFNDYFDVIVSKGLTYVIGALGTAAFIAALCGAYWHIATGAICMLMYLALRSEFKKESHELS